MRPHQKLDLWKRAIELVVAIYKVTAHFPTEEKFGLTSQLRRADDNQTFTEHQAQTQIVE